MKKRILLLALIAAVALLFSCNKKEKQDNQWDGNPAGYEEYRPPAPTTSVAVESNVGKKGFALRVDTPFYLVPEDKGDTPTAKWESNLTLGEAVTLGKVRKLINPYDKKEYEFIEVRLANKKQGYAFATNISAGGKLAVVRENEANLFSEPTITKATNTVVAKKTVLAYYPDTETDDGFVEIKGYDYKTKRLITGFMRLASFSSKENDIPASILLQTAEAMTRDNQTIAKTAILKAAEQDYPDSMFYDEIKNLLNNPSTPNSANNEGVF
jgi:hypothetical protein